MAKRILLPVEFVKPTFLKDRSVKLEFETGEMSGEDIAALSDSRQTLGWLLYSQNESDVTEDIPEQTADPDLQKKPASQRLRNVLYVFWSQKGKPGTWEAFYNTQMEKLIERVKGKLSGE